MNARDVMRAAEQEEREALVSLRRASELTGTPLETLKRWAYRDGVLPIEHVGPTRRVRVRWSVLVHFFGHVVEHKSVAVGSRR